MFALLLLCVFIFFIWMFDFEHCLLSSHFMMSDVRKLVNLMITLNRSFHSMLVYRRNKVNRYINFYLYVMKYISINIQESVILLNFNVITLVMTHPQREINTLENKKRRLNICCTNLARCLLETIYPGLWLLYCCNICCTNYSSF